LERLDLTGLAFDPTNPANLAVWIKVHDRLKAGELPPRNRPRPDATRQKDARYLLGHARRATFCRTSPTPSPAGRDRFH
jgi:hypothetical protein